MHASIHRPTPPPPPTEITLTLTEDEARKLRALFGQMGVGACEFMHKRAQDSNLRYARCAFPAVEDIQALSSAVFRALQDVVPQPKPGSHAPY